MEAAQLRLGFGAFVGTIHPSGQSSGLIAQLPGGRPQPYLQVCTGSVPRLARRRRAE